MLHGCATSPEFRVEAALHRTLILERLRLPLAVTEGRCECGDWVDSKGRHTAACPHSGRLRRRAVAPERTLSRVLARVDGNVCERARAGKETKYAELLVGDRCRLVVVTLVNGGQVEFRSNTVR